MYVLKHTPPLSRKQTLVPSRGPHNRVGPGAGDRRVRRSGIRRIGSSRFLPSVILPASSYRSYLAFGRQFGWALLRLLSENIRRSPGFVALLSRYCFSKPCTRTPFQPPWMGRGLRVKVAPRLQTKQRPLSIQLVVCHRLLQLR